jgi:hypothetical protein
MALVDTRMRVFHFEEGRFAAQRSASQLPQDAAPWGADRYKQRTRRAGVLATPRWSVAERIM